AVGPCKTSGAAGVHVCPAPGFPRRSGWPGAVCLPRLPGVHGRTQAGRAATNWRLSSPRRMKQVLQYRRSGATRVVEVPAPLVPAGGVLVQNQWSLISPGTERMLVEATGGNLLNTARKRPDLVKQVADKLARDG